MIYSATALKHSNVSQGHNNIAKSRHLLFASAVKLALLSGGSVSYCGGEDQELPTLTRELGWFEQSAQGAWVSALRP